jgi:hypothetical protein
VSPHIRSAPLQTSPLPSLTHQSLRKVKQVCFVHLNVCSGSRSNTSFSHSKDLCSPGGGAACRFCLDKMATQTCSVYEQHSGPGAEPSGDFWPSLQARTRQAGGRSYPYPLCFFVDCSETPGTPSEGMRAKAARQTLPLTVVK